MKRENFQLRKFLIATLAFMFLVAMWGYFFMSHRVTGQSSGHGFVIETPEPQIVSISPAAQDGYIANPGMGWQRDNSPYSDVFPETVAYTRSGIRWKDLNPAEGIYDWSPLDDRIHQAKAAGKQFSFRVFTMAGEIYGGHEVPGWVLDKGAVILSSGEPDYTNCVYQDEWERFVDVLINRYDGNPDIAYIDISGYGDFNEWSWSDHQTEWDSLWEKNWAQGTADASTMENLDGEARRRLADLFIGGSYESHRCRTADGGVQIVRYSYSGAHKTQLVMPYAGIKQSAQYVFSKRDDIGFRFDCLGRADNLPFDELSRIWIKAPVIYEFCNPERFDNAVALEYIELTHPILIHNNDYRGSRNDLMQVMAPIGYRYFLKQASSYSMVDAGEKLNLSMTWQNLGTSPIYPKMGQDFELHIYLIDREKEQIVIDQVVDTDLSKWLPADPFSRLAAPEYQVDLRLPIPPFVPPGRYALAGSIVDTRTGLPVNLAMDGEYVMGHFFFFEISVK
jgi:hypothetical protein